jgi:hypothetical protein
MEPNKTSCTHHFIAIFDNMTFNLMQSVRKKLKLNQGSKKEVAS